MYWEIKVEEQNNMEKILTDEQSKKETELKNTTLKTAAEALLHIRNSPSPTSSPEKNKTHLANDVARLTANELPTPNNFPETSSLSK